MLRHYLRQLIIEKKILFLLLMFVVSFSVSLGFIRVVLADQLIRENDGSNPNDVLDEICVNDSAGNFGNFTADYVAPRYIVFTPGGFQRTVVSSSYGFCSGLGVNTTIVKLSDPTNDIITYQLDLWAPGDTTPPTISNLTAGSITQTGATITWTTNETATHTIKYGTTSGSYDSYPNTKSAGSGTSASGAL